MRPAVLRVDFDGPLEVRYCDGDKGDDGDDDDDRRRNSRRGGFDESEMKEWLWSNRKAELMSAVRVVRVRVADDDDDDDDDVGGGGGGGDRKVRHVPSLSVSSSSSSSSSPPPSDATTATASSSRIFEDDDGDDGGGGHHRHNHHKAEEKEASASASGVPPGGAIGDLLERSARGATTRKKMMKKKQLGGGGGGGDNKKKRRAANKIEAPAPAGAGSGNLRSPSFAVAAATAATAAAATSTATSASSPSPSPPSSRKENGGDSDGDGDSDRRQRLNLLDTIARTQRQFLKSEEEDVVFQYALNGLLHLLDSEYGFIAQVDSDEGGVHLVIKALTNVSWDEPTLKFFRNHVHGAGMKLYNMDSLFGRVVTTGEPVISNDPANDPRAAGLPEGHPPMDHFLGLPLYEYAGSDKVVGVMGIANRPGGYGDDDVRYLEPFVDTCCNLIQAYKSRQQNRRLIASLERLVDERTKANETLEEANRKVVQASTLQLTHFACMSHEIRTPLNCLIGLGSLLQETDLDSTQREYLKMILASGELLAAVVDDVLCFSKLQSGNVDINVDRANLQDTVDGVVNAMAIKALEKRITFDTSIAVSVPKYMRTDSRRLQQILFNLLGNAIKFSDSGGSVEFTIECDEALPSQGRGEDNLSSSSSIRFIVKDYGCGIPADSLEKVFTPFLQANGDTERVYGGTGLGLSITRKLVEALGGNISVRSELGRWSEFTVELPVEVEAEEGGPTSLADDKQTSISKDLERVHVIYVADSDNRDRLHRSVPDFYNVAWEEFESMEALEASWPVILPVPSTCKEPPYYLLMVHEDSFRQSTYERLKRHCSVSSSSCGLVTFGPNRTVQESQCHFRSLAQVIPCVLVEKLVSCMKQPEAPARLVGDRVPLVHLRVLIAEDNLVNQKVLMRMLKRLGVGTIDIANNGQEAVELTLKKEYDLVFMDMQMPVMDGLSATRIIIGRRQGGGGGVSSTPRIIFVTAHVSNSFELKALAAGADGFVSKPFDLSKIEEVTRRWSPPPPTPAMPSSPSASPISIKGMPLTRATTTPATSSEYPSPPVRRPSGARRRKPRHSRGSSLSSIDITSLWSLTRTNDETAAAGVFDARVGLQKGVVPETALPTNCFPSSPSHVSPSRRRTPRHSRGSSLSSVDMTTSLWSPSSATISETAASSSVNTGPPPKVALGATPPDTTTMTTTIGVSSLVCIPVPAAGKDATRHCRGSSLPSIDLLKCSSLFLS